MLLDHPAEADVCRLQASNAALSQAPSMAFSHKHGIDDHSAHTSKHFVCCYRAHPRMPPADRGAWRPTSIVPRLAAPAQAPARAPLQYPTSELFSLCTLELSGLIAQQLAEGGSS